MERKYMTSAAYMSRLQTILQNAMLENKKRNPENT